MKQTLATLFLCLSICLPAAENGQAPPLLAPDPRFKADLLLIIAHPDDDTLLAGYLAKLTLDQHKRVSVIYCTSGSGGGNEVGYEAGTSLGQMRIIEAKRALESIGIENVWFLSGRDTPSQNVLWSLDTWGHGRMLDDMVRLVRLTRPDVIVTWLPDYVVGENHGDHQAAGVLATEAFDAAGDPLRFPEQVDAARDRRGMNNLTEGLQPWQAQKLYYQTDAYENMNPYWHDSSAQPTFRKNILEGTGPTYSMTDISPSRHVSYAEIFAKEQAHYSTQGGALGAQAVAQRDFKAFESPVHLIFGKSLVGGPTTGDVFENVKQEAIPYVAAPGYRAEEDTSVSMRIGGSWGFYDQFWKAHAIDHVRELLPVPEAFAKYGEPFYVPLLIKNGSSAAVTVTVSAALPPGWTSKIPYSVYPVRPGETYPVQAELVPPENGRRVWQALKFHASASGKDLGDVVVKVNAGKAWALPE